MYIATFEVCDTVGSSAYQILKLPIVFQFHRDSLSFGRRVFDIATNFHCSLLRGPFECTLLA